MANAIINLEKAKKATGFQPERGEEKKYVFAPNGGKNYALTLGGNTINLGQDQIDWIKDRYAAEAANSYQDTPDDYMRRMAGILPTAFEKSYSGSALDAQLKELNLPSAKYVTKYLSDYVNWYGDGSSYSFSPKATGSISSQFKADWEYEYTIEDQRRKDAGLMPLAIEAKYGDNRRDYELMQAGLPPEAMLTDYVNAFETVEYETAKKDQLYNTATIKIMEAEAALGGYKQLSDADRMRIFDEVYSGSEYDDMRHLWDKSPAEASGTEPIDTLEEYDAKWSGMGKKDAKSDEPSISWNDFISGYEKRKSKVVVDKTAYDTAITETQKKTTASLTNKDEVRQYVDSRSADRPAEIFADMYGAGLSIGRVREAKDYMWGKATTKEEKDAIRSAFGEAANAYTSDAVEGVVSFVSDIFSPEKQAERKAAREGKRSGDAAVKNGVVAQYDNGATSTINADDAEKIFKSHLVYDEKGKATKESIELATNMMYEAGATTTVVLEVGKRSGMKSGILSQEYADKQKETLQDSMMGAYEAQISGTEPVAEQKTPNDLTAFNSVFSDVVAERDLAQRKELIDASYKANVESGNMTSSEFYNAVRRAGWGDTIDVAKDAQSYYTEVYAPKFAKNGEQIPKWEEIDQAKFIEFFESNKDLNPDIHKTTEEIVRGSLSRAFTSGIFEVIGGAVGFADKATAKISGRNEMWDFTKRTTEAIQASQGVSSNQSFGAQAAGLTSTVAGQLVRMYTVAQIGSGVLSMFGAAANATGASAALSKFLATAPASAAKGINALVKASSWAIKSSPFIATAMGSYYTEAIQNGATVEQAVPYANVCGLAEGALEAVGTELWLGRMFGGESLAKGIINAGKSVFKANAIVPKALIIRLLSSALGNALEEGSSYAISVGMQRATYDKDAQFSWAEARDQAGMGALIGLLGAGMNAGADTQSGILAEFMTTEAGQKWLNSEKTNSAFTDLLVTGTIADTVPEQARAAMRMQENGKSVSEVSAMVRDIDQHSRQMDAGEKQYADDIAKIDAELAKKQNAVTFLSTKMEQAATDKSAAGMKKWSKIAEQFRVAQSELEVEQRQAQAKRTERNAAFTETTEQHKIAISKAQESLKGVAVSVAEAFDPQISQIRNLVRDKVSAVPNDIAQEIITKMDAAHAGKLLDYVQTKNDLQQQQYESVNFPNTQATSPAEPLGASQGVQAPTAQEAPQSAPDAPTVANQPIQDAGNIKSEATPANPAETMGLGGISVGAMTSKKWMSEGRTAISQFFTNTLDNMNLDGHTQDVLNAMIGLDEVGTYDVVSEKESIAKAQEKLAQGITPQLLEELRTTNAWSGVQADTAMGILAQYEQNGKDTGDYTDYYNWLRVMQDRLSEGGRGIQALAKYTRDTKVQAVMTAAKNVKKSEKAATPKQKSKVTEQTDKIAKVVDEALKKNATPDAVESEVTKVAKKQTAKSVKDVFIRLQNKRIDRKAFDEHVNKAVKQENGLSGFTTEDAKRVIELLDLAEQQTDSYERRRYQSMAAQIIANTEPVTFGEKFRSVQRIMMLLNPRTMIRNVAANVVFAPFEWAKDLPATLVDMLVAKKTGERTTTVSLQKQAAAIGGLKRGIAEVGKDIKYGVNTSKSTGKYEMTAKNVWRGKFMNFLDDMVGYGLNAGDRPFYEAAYDEFAMNEKLLGHDLESDEVQQRIVNLSLDRVFQGSPAIFEGMKRIRNGIDQFAPPFGTLLIPFTQTPANLADKILDYSVGIIRAGKQLYDASKTGGKFDQKLFVDRVGRAITGNGLMLLGYALAKAGIINMAGDDDKERQAMKNAGVASYSLQLGDASIAINWAEPVGSLVILGATLAKQGANSESLNVIEGGKMMFNSFFDNSIFSNLTALFGSGYGDTASGIENFALGTSTQFLPSTLAAIARTFDPYERDAYDPNKLLAQGKRILSYFPGLRNALPFKYGSDGTPVESNYGSDFFGRMLNTMVNPALVDKKSGDAVNDEIYRLYQGGYTDQLLPVAAKTLANTTLTASQRRELQQMLGEATYNAAQRIVESGSYQSLTDEEKVTALADAVDDAARDAKDAFKNKLGK